MLAWWDLVLVSVALAVDCFSVAVAVGTRFCGPRQVFRIAFHFGVFQGLFTALGGILGTALAGVVAQASPWIAFSLLVLIGLHMIWQARKAPAQETEQACAPVDPTRGLQLIGLSTAVSIDALGTGVSLALSTSLMGFAMACLLIGLVSALAGFLGMRTGKLARATLQQSAGMVAGLVLILLGVKILLS